MVLPRFLLPACLHLCLLFYLLTNRALKRSNAKTIMEHQADGRNLSPGLSSRRQPLVHSGLLTCYWPLAA